MADLMKVSEAASLALYAMGLLALDPEQRLTTRAIAERLDASAHHLAKVMQRLVRAGFVSSALGLGGGFQLTKSAAEFTLLDIYEVIEGPLQLEHCLLGRRICDGTCCVQGGLFQSIHAQIRTHFTETTLADLAQRLGSLKPAEELRSTRPKGLAGREKRTRHDEGSRSGRRD